jgi:hypothetical protein
MRVRIHHVASMLDHVGFDASLSDQLSQLETAYTHLKAYEARRSRTLASTSRAGN